VKAALRAAVGAAEPEQRTKTWILRMNDSSIGLRPGRMGQQPHRLPSGAAALWICA
jgi:hypothetical protein